MWVIMSRLHIAHLTVILTRLLFSSLYYLQLVQIYYLPTGNNFLSKEEKF